MFTGVYTALVTPFKDGKIDDGALEKIIEMQIAGGVDGVVPVGTTGESPTLTYDEHKALIKRVVQLVNGRIKVISGTGSNSTEEAMFLTKSAEDSGVDGVLLVNPYYNKPPQRGLIAHFESVARSVKVPVILYNIPSRTGINFLPESVFELINRVDNVVAMKEASGDIAQMMRLIELCGDRLDVLSGDDNLLLPLLAVGGKGVVSVVSNVLPAEVKRVVNLFNERKVEQSQQEFYRLLPLCRDMFCETNPIPVKAAMEMIGLCSSSVRPPLAPLSDEFRGRLKKTLENYGVKLCV